MTVTDPDRTPFRCLTFVWCAAAISLLVLMVAAPGTSVAQIGGQTGYQEWVPPGAGTDTTDQGGGAAGGGSGAPGSGGALSAGGGSPIGGTGSGPLGARGNGASGGTGGLASGGGGAGTAHNPVGAKSTGARGAADVEGSQSPRPSAEQSEQATGTIPLTRDNILLAFAVAAVAIGAGFGVNRLARRTAGT